MPQLITVNRATLEQCLAATLGVVHGDAVFGKPVKEAISSLRAALANAEPKKFSLTNTSTGTLPQRVESIFETMDKEVAAGRLVRTGPMEWRKL